MTMRLPLFAALAAVSLAMPAFAVEIVAHRGASFDAPENTVASARLAWEQKADALELDVHLSKDGRLIVIHDDSLKRTAGTAKKIADATAAEISKLEAGAWKEARWRGEKIPVLDDMLATVPAGKRVFIEVKCGPEGLDELAAVLKRSTLQPAQTVIISFKYDVVKQAKARFPDREVCWIADFKRDAAGDWQPSISKLIEQARAAKLDGLDLGYRGPLDVATAKEIRNVGLKLYVWTVDAAEDARRLRDLGVDGITTNRPGWLRAQL
jgi:glycerophosphoryl diester phosphodiesterase